MDWWVIVLIVIACLFGLYLLYKVLGYITRFFRWVWKKCCKPPIDACYEGCMTPVGHCCRDTIFVCKEGICDCTDACERCMNPVRSPWFSARSSSRGLAEAVPSRSSVHTDAPRTQYKRI